MDGRSDRVLDELLVLRCQDGEADAFEELVGHWQRKLLRHALHLTGDADGANDVVQEAWLLSLHYLDELGVRDIARALGIPAGTVKSRLFDARNKLKHVLEKEDS